MERNPLIVIPSRTDGAARPSGDHSAVVQSWRRAVEAGLGCVIVDSPDPEVAAAVGGAGGYVYREGGWDQPGEGNYRTPSGAERMAAILAKFDRFYNHDVIINLPDDQVALDPRIIKALMYPLADLAVDIATLVTPTSEPEDEEAIKVEVEWQQRRRVHVLAGAITGRALNFSRKPADIPGPPFYRHLPIYAYKRASLDRFVRQEPTMRELEERLEPIRAIEHGMRIDVVMIEA